MCSTNEWPTFWCAKLLMRDGGRWRPRGQHPVFWTRSYNNKLSHRHWMNVNASPLNGWKGKDCIIVLWKTVVWWKSQFFYIFSGISSFSKKLSSYFWKFGWKMKKVWICFAKRNENRSISRHKTCMIFLMNSSYLLLRCLTLSDRTGRPIRSRAHFAKWARLLIGWRTTGPTNRSIRKNCFSALKELLWKGPSKSKKFAEFMMARFASLRKKKGIP